MLIIRPTNKIEESVTAHPAAAFRTFGIAVLLTVPSSGRHRSDGTGRMMREYHVRISEGPFQAWPHHVLEPFVQHMVQENVRERW
jgi:hypothetical protein